MSNAFIDGLGATLARAREELGLTQTDAANRLKLTPRQIEAIETEDWKHLPSEVFLRGFVRNYARVLNLKPEDLIRPVDRDATTTHTITAPSEGLTFGRVSITRWVTLPLVALALFLMVVALLYQWLSQGEQTLVSAPPGTVSDAGKLAPPPDVALNGETEPPAPAAPPGNLVQPLSLEPQPVEQPSATAPIAPPKAVPASPLSTASPITEAPATPSMEAAREHAAAATTLQFLSAEDAWIQVVDAQGQRFSKLVRAGVAEKLTGKPPYKLVVGNAASVKLTYNGQLIDLKPFIGEKVARLTLE